MPYVVGPRTSINVAIDWTEFDADGQATLMLSLLTRHGRATPLLWLTVDTATLKNRRNEYEYQGLVRLADALPAEIKVCIVADRGFGDHKLYEVLTEELKFDFVIRFRGNIHVTAADGEMRTAAAWVGRGGRARVLRGALVTAERYNNAYNPWMITYVGFDAGWFNLRENVQNALMPFAQGAESNLANGLNGGSYSSPFSRVVYANNHDECWWDGGPNQSKLWPVSQFGGRGDYWSQKKSRMMSALSFFVPGIPLFFMGDEFAMQGSFHDADFNNILDWGLETDTLGNQFKAMFRSLIQIRQTYSQLTDPNTQFLWLQYPKDGWFAFKRKENGSALIVAGNWTGDDIWNYGVYTNGETGNWTQIFNSDGQEFGGDGVGNFMNNPNSDAGSITINIPKNGIVVMNRTSV